MQSFASELSSSGEFQLVTGSEAVRARCHQQLLFLIFEWELGPTLGTDYTFRTPADMQTELDRQLGILEGVTGVRSTMTESTDGSRQWLYEAGVSSIYGDVGVSVSG